MNDALIDHQGIAIALIRIVLGNDIDMLGNMLVNMLVIGVWMDLFGVFSYFTQFEVILYESPLDLEVIFWF